MQKLPIKSIVPDTNQPRKYFNAEKIKTLKNSIKQHGIVNPVVVQEMAKGKFLLVDGERRYRAATELGLKEIPAIIEKPQSEVERLVRQFNIQEQHEEWTPVEKAVAMLNLTKKMHLSIKDACNLLNIVDREARRYAAFGALLTKDSWVRNEIPLIYAGPIRGIINLCSALYEHELEEEFTPDMVRKLETKFIALIKAGNIAKSSDITKLRDAFTKSPKSIAVFIKNSDATPASLFASTKARGAYHLRNAVMNSRWLCGHTARYLEAKDVTPTAEEVAVFRRAARDLNLLIAQAR